MRKSLVVSLLAAIAASAVTQAGMASTVTFTAPTITADVSPAQVAAGYTVTANITISDAVATDILAGYGLDLFLSSTPGNVMNPSLLPTNLLETAVTITGFSLNTTPAYVYNNSNPGNSNNSNDIEFTDGAYLSNYTTSDGSTVANELYNGDTYANTDVALLNATWGLATVDLTVAAGFTGTVYLVWNADGQSNDSFAPFYELLGAPSTPLDPNLVPGSFTVGLVPEPGSVVLMVLGSLGLLGMSWRRTRRTS